MNRTTQVMRIGMADRWTAADLGIVLSDLAALYEIRFALALLQEDLKEWEIHFEELLHFPPFRRLLRRSRYPVGLALPWQPFVWRPKLDVAALRMLVEPNERLRVERLSYASPGATDLAGVAAIMGHIKDFVLRLFERHDDREKRRLEDERIQIENDRLRLENARQLVSLAQDLGYPPSEVRSLVMQVDMKQQSLVEAISSGKLVKVELLEEAGGDKPQE